MDLEMKILIKETECPVEGWEDKTEAASSKLHKGAQIKTGKGDERAGAWSPEAHVQLQRRVEDREGAEK